LYISYLNLTNFRNYSLLELDFPKQHIVIHGENAQGKTNLLEALYILSTTRSYRTGNEKEFIKWSALEEPDSITRIIGNFQKEQGDIKIEIDMHYAKSEITQKRIKVNDIPRRASEVIGQVNMVMFEAQDCQLTSGPAILRRRYLDLINSQIDHHYLYSLQRYNRVLTQRNHLLRLINEGQARADQLDFWDNELSINGVYLILHRQQMINGINESVRTIFRKLSQNKESLKLKYLPKLKYDMEATQKENEELILGKFHKQLQESRGREIAAGLTLVGPHRDDFRFLVNDVDVGIYGSRGQQRITVLAIKLAQAEYSKKQTGEYPIMLLDDILSELDITHRRQLLEFVTSLPQIILTTTDIHTIEPFFLEQSVKLKVIQGNIE